MLKAAQAATLRLEMMMMQQTSLMHHRWREDAAQTFDDASLQLDRNMRHAQDDVDKRR